MELAAADLKANAELGLNAVDVRRQQLSMRQEERDKKAEEQAKKKAEKEEKEKNPFLGYGFFNGEILN